VRPALARKSNALIENNTQVHRVYIDTSETITDVRERLARLPQQSIALVVPQPTQLQNIVAWKLLARCVEELGKEVLIVSSDRQIRALAKSVKLELIPAALPTERSPRALRKASERAS
jgi:hypothetical protein